MEKTIPLIALPPNENSSEMKEEAAFGVSKALQTSGFLLVTSEHLPLALQRKATQVAYQILNENSNENELIITHPSDPKIYAMLDSLDQLGNLDVLDEQRLVLTQYWNALERVKEQVLDCISLGLGLPTEYFMNFHKKNNSALRLLHYPGETHELQDGQNTIRCKPHSDYGSITLLLTDGVPGLQALIQDKWINVPHVEGALVVNIGSLMSEWTGGKLLATLHRVVSLVDDNAGCKPRTSIAFFADPDEEISVTLKGGKAMNDQRGDMTVAEYIKWRSGGSERGRSGLAFTNEEESRVNKSQGKR